MKSFVKWLVIIVFIVLATSCKTVDIVEDDEVEDLKQIPEEYTFYDNYSNDLERRQDKIYTLYDRTNAINDNDWSRALWCFSPYEDPKLIADGEGLDFRVCQNSKYIAVESNGNIEFFSGDGELLRTLPSDELNTEEDVYLQLEQWNDDSSIVWCSLYHTIITMSYISIDPETLEIVKYSDRDFRSDEHVLNPNTGWVVYSDLPVMFDVIDEEEYMESNQMTTLSIYNLMTKEQIEIASYESNRFNPEWRSDSEIAYYIGDKMKIYNLNE